MNRKEKLQDKTTDLKTRLPQHLLRSAKLASEKGAYSWLTALLITAHGFALHKGAFRDALCLRYGWTPTNLPSECVCGVTFITEHALTCPTGGTTIIRHNEVRDIMANLLTEVCHDVRIEPHLQSIADNTFSTLGAASNDDARLDVVASGFWGGRFEKTFLDVRILNPYMLPQTNLSRPLHVTGIMNARRDENMSKGSGKLNIPLSCHWSYPVLVEPVRVQPSSSSDLRLCWLRNTTRTTALYWGCLVAASASPSSDHPSIACGVHDHHTITLVA